ncbi:hypothetical protein P9112_000582 [Eukaryota sp. TZLM1-RC]
MQFNLQPLYTLGPSIRGSSNAGHFVLTYEDESSIDEGSPIVAISDSPIDTTKAFYAEVEIISIGQCFEYAGAIGVGPRNYPPDCLPGWEEGSVAYHCDNGEVHDGCCTEPSDDYPIAQPGDTVGLLLWQQQVYFTHNGVLLNVNNPFSCPQDPCHLMVGLIELGESLIVKLQSPFSGSPEALLSTISGPLKSASLMFPFAFSMKPENFRAFMTEGSENDDFECPVCLDIVHDAVETECCRTLFCQGCIHMDKCPYCRSLLKSKPEHSIRRIVAGLATTCSLCNYKTTRGTFPVHFEECPSRKRSCCLCSQFVSDSEMEIHLMKQHPEML